MQLNQFFLIKYKKKVLSLSWNKTEYKHIDAQVTWKACPAFYELPDHICFCTLLVKMSYSSTPSVWCAIEVDLSDGFPQWHQLLTLSVLARESFSVKFALIVMQSNCDSLESLWVLLSTFKINQPLSVSITSMQRQYFLLETTVVKLLNKRATGLYSIPRLLQHTPVPAAISCWCSAFFHSGWIGRIVYKDGRYVKLT